MFSKLNFIFITILLISSVQAQEIQLIVSKKLNVKSPRFRDVQKLFLGQKKFLENSSQIVSPGIYYNKKSELKKFYRMLKVSERQYKSIWRRKMFGGLAIPPQVFTNQKNIQDFFEEQTNGVVITLSKAPLIEDVKIIKINE